jgi:hypothetical protein
MRTELVFYDVNYYFPYFYYLQTLILRCNRRYNWKVGGVCGTRGHEKKKSLEIGCSHHLTKHTLLWVTLCLQLLLARLIAASFLTTST